MAIRHYTFNIQLNHCKFFFIQFIITYDIIKLLQAFLQGQCILIRYTLTR